MKITSIIFSALILTLNAFFMFSCNNASNNKVELLRFSLNNLDNIIDKNNVEFDNNISSDKAGSIKISATSNTTIKLFTLGDIDIENAKLIYSAKIKTQDFSGKVYLEMLLTFKDKGEYFSRALDKPIINNTDWTEQQTPFFLKQGENPTNVKLNLVIEGKGIVWIDDIVVFKSPL